MKLGPDDRQRQHVAGCKPSRNTPPSRISQSSHTVSSNPCCLPQSPSYYLGLPLPRGIWGQIPHLNYHHLFEHHWDCPNHNSTGPDRGSSSCSLFASSSRTKHASYSSQSRCQILDPALVGQSQERPQGRHDSYLQKYTIHMYILYSTKAIITAARPAL